MCACVRACVRACVCVCVCFLSFIQITPIGVPWSLLEFESIPVSYAVFNGSIIQPIITLE